MAPDRVRWVRNARWLLLCLALTPIACSSKITAPPEPPPSVRRGDRFFRYEEYDAAIDAYRTYIEQEEKDDYTARVFYKTALAQYRLGRYHEALTTLRGLAHRFPDTQWVQTEALRGDCERALGRPLDAIRSWDRAWKLAKESDHGKLRQRLITITHDMTDSDIERAQDVVEEKEVKKLLHWQLAIRPNGSNGEAPMAAAPAPFGSTEEEEQLAQQPGGRVTGSETSPGMEPQPGAAIAAPQQPSVPDLTEEPLAGDRLQASANAPGMAPVPPPLGVQESSQQGIATGTVKIGCLLPLTGPAGDFGQRSLRGLKLLLGSDNSLLVVRDTISDEATALRLFQELSQDPNVIAVIGPLRSEEAKAVAPAAEQAQIPLLLLSQQDGLAGQFTLQAGMTRSSQLTTLLDYAMGKVRLRRFGVLYPHDSYGEEFFSAFKSEVTRRGGTIVGADAYAPGTPTAATDQLKRWRNSGNLQAVFVPDDAISAAQIARFLQEQMPDVTLLGVHGWQRLAGHGQATGLNGILFADGFYIGSSRPATRDFVERFRQVFSEPPGVLEAQAYDAGFMAQRALQGGARSRLAFLEQLRTLQPMEGATGELVVGSGGIEHRLFLLRVHDGALQEISYAAGGNAA